jgi:fatty-acyl-CoA synthase
MIKSNGHRLYPQEVEEELAAHPDVLEVVAFGVPDEVSGERVIAVVRGLPGLQAASLRASAVRRLPPHAVPRVIVVWPDWPRTSSGKPALAEIRRLYLDQVGAGT